MRVGELNAYAAGLFDGEGYVIVGYYAKNDSYRPQIGITMHSEKVLALLAGRWGGAPYTERLRIERKLRMFTWILTGGRARKFLEDVLPYLVVKKEEARCILPVISRHRGKEEKREVRERLRQIRKRRYE